MIVLDTSVWIEFLNAHEPYFTKVSKVLSEGRVVALDVVLGELLQGARTKRETKLIADFFENLPIVKTENCFYHAGLLSQKENLLQAGIGLMDAAILYTCYTHQIQLWTLDKKILKKAARETLYLS